MEKFLKIVFIAIGAVIIIGLVILLLPLLIIGILLGLLFGKLKIAQLNALSKRKYGCHEDAYFVDSNDLSEFSDQSGDSGYRDISDGQGIDYEDGEIIDVQAKEVDEKQ